MSTKAPLATGETKRTIPEDHRPILSDSPDAVLQDLLNPATRGELYPHYHRLRSLAPVHEANVQGLPPGTWALTSIAAVDRVARSSAAVNDPRTAKVFDYDGQQGPFYRLLSSAMLFLDKPAHDRVRRLVFRAFTPRAVAPLGELTAAVGNDLIDAAIDRGSMDFVTDYAYPLPIRAICQLLGLPEGFYDLFDQLLGERRAHPGQDIMSVLVSESEDGERLSHEEAISTCVLLLQAGHETTADLLGNALVGLFRHPGELRWLIDNPTETRSAVEELLRYDCSVQMSMRLVTEDLDVEGRTIPAGSLAALFYGAANRDPERFTDPDVLDLRRNPQHLALSAGAYYCLGNALARVELTAGVAVLLDRLPDIQPASETFVQRRTMRLRGPQELLVRW